MNHNYTNTELLTKYLDGELPGEELNKLEIRFKEDDSLRDELDNLKISLEAIKSYGLREKVHAIHGDMMKEIEQQSLPKKGKMRRLSWYALRVAAAVIIIAGSALFYQYTNLTSASLYENNINNYTIHENRGTENKSVLEAQYEAANYTAVINAFKKTSIKTTQDYFLTGNAYLYLGKPSDAIESFLALQQLNSRQQTHQYADDSEYYLAMGYLANSDPAKALPLFEKIHSDKNHLYHPKVSAWFLQKVKRVR